MANDQRFDSRYTGEEMENAFSVALAIANHAGIPKGTGKGNIQILSMDTDRLTSDGERIPTSAVVAQAIAAARKVSELLVFKGIVQTTDDLPADAKPGFVYIVAQKDNENYAWDGVSWTPIGKLIAPIVLSSQSVSYQISDSGDAVPSGEWLTEFPEVQQGKYLWTRTVVQFSVGDPITSYSCAYIGVDGREIAVCGVKADESGNVVLTAKDVSAVPTSGGTMTAVETDVFDGKCPAYIEGYRYITDGETWTRPDGVTFSGEMIAPWRDWRQLDAAQRDYEQEQYAAMSAELADAQAALEMLGVTPDE